MYVCARADQEEEDEEERLEVEEGGLQLRETVVSSTSSCAGNGISSTYHVCETSARLSGRIPGSSKFIGRMYVGAVEEGGLEARDARWLEGQRLAGSDH